MKYKQYDHIYYIDAFRCKVKRGTVVSGYEDNDSYPTHYDLVVGFYDRFYDYEDYEEDFAWEDVIYSTKEEAAEHLLDEIELDAIESNLKDAEELYNYYKDLKARFEAKNNGRVDK